MRYISKITTVLCSAAFGLMALTGCEGSDIYNVDSPDWLQSKIDSINAANSAGALVIPDGTEDVYTTGATDFSTTGWWAAFTKYYQVPNGQKWDAVFNLNINPKAAYSYYNFALILSNDIDRGGTGYAEYCAIRFDTQPSGNSEWDTSASGGIGKVDRTIASAPYGRGVYSNLTFSTDTDEGVTKLGGKVVLTVDRTNPDSLKITMNNGTVKKTYVGLSSVDPLYVPNGDPIRCFLVPQGSYIGFLQSNIEPIGGFTPAEDREPVSMTLNDVPDEVAVGSDVEKALSGISANIYFKNVETPTVVPYAQLMKSIDGDFSTEGVKDVVFIYNKTLKGNNATTPVYVRAKINVKALSQGSEKYFCPTPITLGATDNSTGWWGAHSSQMKVEPNQTIVTVFKNYSSKANVWNNFVTCLTSEDQKTEYAILRADNYGWGTGFDACTRSTTVTDYAVLDGATVTTYTKNNGDGTADVTAVMVGSDGNTYYQYYTGVKVDKNNLYVRYTVDGCHLVFENTIGATDNSSGWWGAHSTQVTIPTYTAYTMTFINYSNCANQWNNAVVCLTNSDKGTEYAILRADNYGWGTGYNADGASTTVTDWAEFTQATNGATVELTVINNNDGTCDVTEIWHCTNNKDYTQTYTGLKVNKNDLTCRLTVDGCHMVYVKEDAASAKKSFIQYNGRKFIYR